VLENLNVYGIKSKLSDLRLIKCLTLKERKQILQRSSLQFENDNCFEEYLRIKSKASREDVYTKCKLEGLVDKDFSMAFYDGSNKSINEELLKHIQNENWYKFFEEAVIKFDNLEADETVSCHYESRYDIFYPICFITLYAKEKIEECLKNISNITVRTNVIAKMLEQINNNCLQVYSKTIIFEFHRNKDKYLETSHREKKFNLFIKDIFSNTEKLIGFYLEYPVLLRRLSIKVSNMVNYFIEIINNIDSVWEKLQEGFVATNNSVLTDINCNIGDTHEKGKFVIKLLFGQDILIYKPRNLYITKKYYEFINWLNHHSNLYKLPVLKSLWMDNFTVETFVEYTSANSVDEVERFYKRIGYNIGLLYLFNGNDIHFENIVAHGEYPYIIDLETLFSHQTEQLLFTGTAFEYASRIIGKSVKGTCLLPTFAFQDEGGKGVDISGLNGKRAELPSKQLMLTEVNSDDIKFEFKKTFLENHSNIPMINDNKVSYLEYIDCIIHGYEEFIRFILDNKESVLIELNKFKDIKTRQIMKATNNYAYMLQFASHPNYTGDMIKLERMFDRLWSYPYSQKSVASSEFEELLDDDIPMFYCNTSGKDIMTGRGSILSNFYQISSFNEVVDKVRHLSNDEIYLQTLLINDSLGILHKKIEEQEKKNYDAICFRKMIYNEYESRELSYNVLQTVYDNIFNILDKNKVCGSEDVSWLQVINVDSGVKTISVIKCDLENGLSGIMLYLYYQWIINDDERCNKLLQEILAEITNIQGYESKSSEISAINGIASVIYPFVLCSGDSIDSKFITLVESVLAWIELAIDTMNNDKISIKGLSSLIIVLLNIYSKTDDYKYYTTANLILKRILKLGVPYAIQVSDENEIDMLIYSLHLAYKHTGNESVQEMARELLETVRRSTYGELYSNNNTHIANEKTCSPKSGYYKIKLLSLYKDDLLIEEIENCYKSIIRLNNSSINEKLETIDFLLLYSKIFNSSEPEKYSKNILLDIIGCYQLDSTSAYVNYDYILEGIGLSSAACGLGFRLLKYINRKYVSDIYEL